MGDNSASQLLNAGVSEGVGGRGTGERVHVLTPDLQCATFYDASMRSGGTFARTPTRGPITRQSPSCVGLGLSSEDHDLTDHALPKMRGGRVISVMHQAGGHPASRG